MHEKLFHGLCSTLAVVMVHLLWTVLVFSLIQSKEKVSFFRSLSFLRSRTFSPTLGNLNQYESKMAQAWPCVLADFLPWAQPGRCDYLIATVGCFPSVDCAVWLYNSCYNKRSKDPGMWSRGSEETNTFRRTQASYPSGTSIMTCTQSLRCRLLPNK